MCIRDSRNGSLSSVVAVSTVGTAVLLGLFFAVYLYATQGNLSMEIITGPLDEISNALDDEIYAMVHQLYANYPSEQLDALVTMALTQKDYMFEMILLYMPGPVSYTHLDVYKRQYQESRRRRRQRHTMSTLQPQA